MTARFRMTMLALGMALAACATQQQAGSVPASTAAPRVPLDPAVAQAGRQVFERWCNECHAPGREHPGSLQLEIDRGRDRAYLLSRDDIVPDYVKIVVRNGYRSMPPFKPTEVSDAELEQLAAYVSSTPDPARGAP